MEIIYSKINSNIILIKHFKMKELTSERKNLSEDQDILQVGVRILSEGFEVPAHRHLTSSQSQIQTIQEIWILLSGKITANIYDLDNTFLRTLEVDFGDIVIYKNGGHSLVNYDKKSALYEIKSGPYLGMGNDKEFI